MLRGAKDLRDYAIRAIDGAIGKVDDLYLDNESWSVRYLVVNTGNWLFRQESLISPALCWPRGLDRQAVAGGADQGAGGTQS